MQTRICKQGGEHCRVRTHSGIDNSNQEESVILNLGTASEEVNSQLTQGRPQLIVVYGKKLIHFILQDRRETNNRGETLNLPNVSWGGRDGREVAELI